jgi:hypothetical protein
MPRDIRLYLDDIIKAISLIKNFVKGYAGVRSKHGISPGPPMKRENTASPRKPKSRKYMESPARRQPNR